jgi:hypothetical protein
MKILHTAAALAVAALVTGGCAPTGGGASPENATPRQMLERAIRQAGGEGPLTAARALVWRGQGVAHAGEHHVNIVGDWEIQPPDTAIVSSYEVARGQETTRSLVLAAPRGWLVSGTSFRRMPATLLANERDQFYLYDVIRLVPLRAPGVTLTPIAPDSLGQPGFRAEQPDRPAVDLYFSANGRLAHLRADVHDAASAATKRQDMWLSGTIESAGVRWFREMKMTMDGEPYFDLTVRSLRVMRRIDDPRLAGPPARR